MVEIYADGILWEDSDGITAFSGFEAAAICGMLREMGYEVWTIEV